MGKNQDYWADVTPSEYISLMFEKTSEYTGCIYLPGWYQDDLEHGEIDDRDLVYECAMAWTKTTCRQAIADFNALYRSLQRIAELSAQGVPDRTQLEAEGLAAVWDAYLRPLEAEDRFDMDRIREIDYRAWGEARKLRMAEEIVRGRRITPSQKKYYMMFLDCYVEKDERALLAEYRRAIGEEAERRIGAGLCATDVICRAQGLVHTMRILKNAPAPDPRGRTKHLHEPDAQEMEEILRSEARRFAAVYVIHRFADEKKTVDASHQKREEKRLSLEQLEEEGVDTDLYRRRKMNDRKSMAPMFVHHILKQHSSPARHLSQKEILDYLSKEPYEITMERKALSRIIHGLADSQVGICFWGNDGAWYDPSENLIDI